MDDYEKRLKDLQYQVGIGSGSNVDISGEAAAFVVLKLRITPPYCVFDVGANKGKFVELFIDKAGFDYSSIHCFEPSKPTFNILKRNLDEKIIDKRIKLNNTGLGIRKEKSTLYYDKEGSGLASLTRRRLDHFNIYFDTSEQVEIDTIDNYCEKNNIDHIHLLKLDIEGHELFALRGAEKMLYYSKIDLVMFEFGGCNIDTRTFFQDFWYLLTPSFQIYRITPKGGLLHIPKYDEIHEQFRTTNYLAVRNGV